MTARIKFAMSVAILAGFTAVAWGETEVVEPKTLYVDAANGNDTADGFTRATAVASLQEAVNRTVDGDSIIVSDGTYAPIHTGDKRITIESENGYKTTIIDGGWTNGCIEAEGTAMGFPFPSTNVVIRGFTLTNGHGYRGAGVCGGTLERCLIFGNVAINEDPGHGMAYIYGRGGGAYGSMLRYCTIVNNSAEFWPGNWEGEPASGGEGGGVYDCTLANCIVYDNEGEIAPDACASDYSSDSLVGVDPLFADAANGDYRLISSSPCVVNGVATAGCETEVVEPKTLYVDATNGNDSADGLSKANAVKTLQVAIDRATNSDRILVADGVYAPIHTYAKHIVIESENGYKTTIIDGGGTNDCVAAVVVFGDWANTNSTLRGFTLSNGRSRFGGGVTGGILERCLIIGCTATAPEDDHEAWSMMMVIPFGHGGGAFSSTLRYCTVVGNTAERWAGSEEYPSGYGGEGGGVYGCTLENCIVYDNEGEIAPDACKSDYSSDSLVGVDPLFANAATGDYRLISSSPCVVNGVATAGCETEVVEPKTLYVDATNGNDSADGLSKANAVKTLQVAINRATNSDRILVADGIYTPIWSNSRHLVIESENGYKTTIIDGGGTNACASFWHVEAGYLGLAPSPNAILRGFTLRNGYAIHGAGISGGTLEHCLVAGNVAYNEVPGFDATFYYGQGGGAYGSVLRYCTIVNNFAEFWPGDWEGDPQASGGEGGGVYGCTLENCIVYDNEGEIAPDACASDYSSDSLVGVDPLFADAATGDYRLISSSPCVVNGVATAGCETEVVEPKTLYVDATNGNDSADGLSKANAFKTLQTAVDLAKNGDTIMVGDGIYAPIQSSDKRIVIESENGYKTTIIDGGGANACVSFWICPTLFPFPYPSRQAILRGFTLRGGRSHYGAGTYGGTLEYCLIIGNTAYNEWPGYNMGAGDGFGQGGGAYGSTLRYCTVVGNSAEFWSAEEEWEEDPYNTGGTGGEGGGVYGCTLENCIVYGNEGEIAPDACNSDYSSDSLVGVDPLFVNAANGDYRLMSSSPCVVNGVATAGCETEVMSGTVPELSPEQVAAWVFEDLATRYAKSGESAVGYQSRFEAKFGTDPVAAMSMPTDKKDAQGYNMYVWQDYVAGTDPTDTNSVFTAKIDVVDGVPVVTWSPELPPAQTALRTYTIYGKTNLTDKAWHSPTNEASRFFKVGVEMR